MKQVYHVKGQIHRDLTIAMEEEKEETAVVIGTMVIGKEETLPHGKARERKGMAIGRCHLTGPLTNGPGNRTKVKDHSQMLLRRLRHLCCANAAMKQLRVERAVKVGPKALRREKRKKMSKMSLEQ